MKITFISPKGKTGLFNIHFFRNPPMGLMRLASSTPKGWDIEIIDEQIQKIKVENTDLVAISAMTCNAKRGYEIADEYRKKGIKVVLGGIHPSMLPDEAIKHADSVVIGEADFIWSEVLKDFKEKKLKRFYEVKELPNLSKLPLLKRELISKKYFFSKFIQTTRGCPFGCDFCSVSKFNGRIPRHRPLKEIIKEIKNLKGFYKRYFAFADDNIVADPKYTKELFRAIRPLKVKWGAQCSINIAKDDELLKLAGESGCKLLFIGFESINQDALNEVHKAYKVEEYKELIKKIHNHGIAIMGGFIFGFDSDTKDTFKKTTEFCIDVNLIAAHFSFLTPPPGTKLHEKLKKENRILTFDWDKYDYGTLVIKPKNISSDELKKEVIQCYRRFYSYKLILKRIFSMMPKIGLYYSLVLLYINYDARKAFKKILTLV